MESKRLTPTIVGKIASKRLAKSMARLGELTPLPHAPLPQRAHSSLIIALSHLRSTDTKTPTYFLTR